ncbi:MAG: hypothetical protein H8D67_07920 [Deltaproteobacteria bacterium]|nr:hypothetical protein [Deltaproteobacteria bacterium]
METLKKTQFFLTNMPIEKVLVLSEKLYVELANLERLDSSDTNGKLRKLLDELLEVISIQPNGAEIMLPQADGNYYPFQPAKPVSLATLLALVEAGRKAQVIRKLPREEQLARLKKSLEYARAEATARGIALEDEKDAAIYD